MNHFIRHVSDWKHWPFFLFYLPVSFVWVWNYVKSRSFWYFSASNPTVSLGGFEGEGKEEIYRQLAQNLYPRSIYIQPACSFASVKDRVLQHRITYPFVVKPDVGMKGILFRKIEGEEQLEKYHRQMPAAYIIQEFVTMPLEVSVFYYRLPDSPKGCISALIQKELLEVIGNGKDTVLDLVLKRPDAKSWLSKIKEQNQQLETVPEPGERFYLSHIANLYHGATFTNLTHQVTDQLLAIFDEISYSTLFYYGRYDIKCGSVADLLSGKNFTILEFNGAGSVPNHIFTGTFTLLQAYKEILRHWKALYQISKQNHEKGHRYWNFRRGYQFLQASKKHFKQLKRLDKELTL